MKTFHSSTLQSLFSPIGQYTALIIFGVFVWWQSSRYTDLKYAWGGFSPIIYVYQKFQPENFIRDFYNGTGAYDSSLIMQVYPWFDSTLGISPEAVLPIFIAFEYIIIALALILLTRTLRPKAPTIVAILVVTLVIASYAREMNLARFGQYTFWGLYYNFADAMRLLAIVAILKKRPILSSLLLAASFTSHPAMGLMGGVFIGATLLVKAKESLKHSTLLGGLLFTGIAVGWSVLSIDSTSITSTAFPNQIWFNFTKLCSSHWYPIDYGLFTIFHQERFVQFIAFLILLTFYLSRSAKLNTIDKKIIYGFLAMLTLVIFGLIFSVTSISPTLVKLSLHRANDLIVSIGLIYVVYGLWEDLTSTIKWRQLIAALILISPLIMKPGFPLVFSLALTAPSWLKVFQGKSTQPGDLVVTALSISSIVLLSVYGATGMLGDWISPAYTGFAATYFRLLTIALSCLVILTQRWNYKQFMPLVTLILCTFLAVTWVNNQSLSPAQASLYNQFYQAQLWAKDNTAKDALFMLDPAQSYGWRDYSERSSFGVLHEWLYSSFAYLSNYDLFQEGFKRFQEFDLDIEPYLKYQPPLSGYAALREQIREKYYSYGDEWRLDLANRYNIDYFVLMKESIKESSQLPIAYENEDFMILATPQLQ
ncbi:MAG: hypothetical protein F6J86_12585 [Symploca sp. SIO1B1]|nr:hypothetical protein [Symploca sp. SIO1B1]